MTGLSIADLTAPSRGSTIEKNGKGAAAMDRDALGYLLFMEERERDEDAAGDEEDA